MAPIRALAHPPERPTPTPAPTAVRAPAPASQRLVPRLRAAARLYSAVGRSSFRRYATYRTATWAGILTNTVFGFFIAYTYQALWRVRPHLGGYDLSAALTYVWVGQALLMPIAAMGGGFQDDLEARITTGDVAVDLYRPADLQAWWLANDLGRACFHLLARGVVPLLVGALAFPLRMPGGGPGPAALTWAATLLSVLLAVVVSFALRYIASLTGFWMLDARGVRQIGVVLGMFFSGLLLPLPLFPGQFAVVVQHLPWAAMFQVPADVFLQRRHGAAAVAGLALQALWAVALLGAGRLVQRAVMRKVVLQGG